MLLGLLCDNTASSKMMIQKQASVVDVTPTTNPKISVFDETTSALDYESERIVTENTKDICKGRTAIIIAHRPSTLELAARIVAVEKGRVNADDVKVTSGSAVIQKP